jgi:hypothetical protein
MEQRNRRVHFAGTTSEQFSREDHAAVAVGTANEGD